MVNGKSVARLSIATSQSWKDKSSGERKEKIIQDQKNKTKVTDCEIVETNTVNGIRFSLSNGSWGLIRASSNKPSLVIVIESLVSNEEVEMIFKYINTLLNETGKVGEYDQKL